MIHLNLTKELVNSLKEISELIVEKNLLIDSLSNDCRESIKRHIKVSNIGASSRIENAVLTDIQIDWLDETLAKNGKTTSYIDNKVIIENKFSKENERSVEEIAGCRNMLSIVYNQGKELFPLTEITVRGLHFELLQFYSNASYHKGSYKTQPNSVIGKDSHGNVIREVLKTADPGSVTEIAMRDLIEWYNRTLPSYPWGIAVACEFVFRFLAIHPFLDGNGRIGRALFILALLQSTDNKLSSMAPYIAIDRHIEKNKEEYYLVLRKCSDGKFSQDLSLYKMEYLLKFILKVIKNSLNEDIEYNIGRYMSYLELSETSQKILKCFKEHPEIRLGTKNIISYTNIPRRTVIHSLNILVNSGFLQKYGKSAGVKYQLIF